MGANRRKLYRVDIGANIGLRCYLCGKGDIEIGVELVDLSYAGAGMMVPPSIRQALTEGQHIALKFESSAVDWRISASGCIQNIIEIDDDFRIGVEFTDLRAVAEQLTPAIQPLFNRRRAYRISTQILGEVTCKWGPVDQRNVGTKKGHVIDVSGNGIAISANTEDADLLIDNERYRVHFKVRDESINFSFDLIAYLRHRSDREDFIRLGLEFENDNSNFFQEQQANMFRLVAELQRRTLKASSDTEKFY